MPRLSRAALMILIITFRAFVTSSAIRPGLVMAAESAQTAPAEGPVRSPAQKEPEPSQKEIAKQELQQEERQRILRIVPNFNMTDIRNAAPLTAGEKFQLAFREATDPFEFAAAASIAAYGQWRNNLAVYGGGPQGYGKRLGTAYADAFSGFFWGNAVLPSVLHEDPRYYREGASTIKHRLMHSLATTFWTRNDNGSWGPNYANVLGNVAAASLSNVYYPAGNRGFGPTLERAATLTAGGAIGETFVEFWPDIRRKLFRRGAIP